MKNGTYSALNKNITILHTRATSTFSISPRPSKLVIPISHGICFSLLKNPKFHLKLSPFCRTIHYFLLKTVSKFHIASEVQKIRNLISERDSHIFALFNEIKLLSENKEYLSEFHKHKNSLKLLYKLSNIKHHKPSLYLHKEFEIVQRGEYKKEKARVIQQLNFHKSKLSQLNSQKSPNSPKIFSANAKIPLVTKFTHFTATQKPLTKNKFHLNSPLPRRVPLLNLGTIDRQSTPSGLTCGVFLCTPKNQQTNENNDIYFSECITKNAKELNKIRTTRSPTKIKKNLKLKLRSSRRNNNYWGIVDLINKKHENTFDKQFTNCTNSTKDSLPRKIVNFRQNICSSPTLDFSRQNYRILSARELRNSPKNAKISVEKRVKSRMIRALTEIFKPLGKKRTNKHITLIKAYKPNF